MRYKFFNVPAADPTEAEADLNRFLAGHRVLDVENHFVSDGVNSAWTLCVRYTTPQQPAMALSKKGKIDYKEVLSEAEFAVFAKLRELRKRIADQEAVPPYALFTNDQLAEMVRGRILTRSDMAKISGIGPARIEKYAEPFLAILSSWGQPEREGEGDAEAQPGEPE